MNVREEKPDLSGQKTTAGQDFVQRIRPAGCVLFLALAILVAAVCLTAGRNPIAGYTPPQSMEYYAQEPQALLDELETSVFPALPDYQMSGRLGEDGTVVVTIDSDSFVAGRSAVLRYFDEALITFERGKSQ